MIGEHGFLSISSHASPIWGDHLLAALGNLHMIMDLSSVR